MMSDRGATSGPGDRQAARSASQQVPSGMLAEEFGKVYVHKAGDDLEVEFTVWVQELSGALAEGWQTGLALDASAGEVQLLEFINNKRYFRERNRFDIPIDQWLTIEVRVTGKEITADLDGRPCLRFAAPLPVSGYVGLWSKGDTTAYFRKLGIDEALSHSV